MKLKKLLSIVLSVSMMLSLVCVSSAAAEDVQVIRMWSNDQHDQKVVSAKIDEFNETIGKEQGISVEYTVYGSDYYNTLDVAVSAKKGPDIFKCNKIGNYAEAGYIIPWESEPGLKNLIDRFAFYNAPGYGEFFGKTYSVPIRVTTYGIACNNEIFAANNLELPTTWEEMQEAARIITENGRGRQYGYALAMGYGSYHYFYVTLANGASTGDEYFNHTTGKYDFASLSGFLNHVKSFIADGSMFPGFETMDGDTARAQFSAGNIGMIGVMSSDVTTFKNQFPCDFEWTMIPYPTQSAETYYKQPVGVSNSYVIGESAKNGGYTDKVATFLNYLYSDELFVATNDAQVDISILGDEITSQSTNKDLDPNWIRFSDMNVFSIKYPNPDSDLIIEGDTYQDVIGKIITGIITDADAALAELDVKYNAALDAAVEAGKVKLEDYIDPDIAVKMQPVK